MPDTPSPIRLTSPLKGWVTALDEVPDPVFSGRMLGDGVAIEPLDTTLHAPCDGEIVSLHRGGHAVTLRTTEGAEVLMHIGIDTVARGGVGFRPMVSVGETVRRGDPLIAFELDALLAAVPAMTTPIVLTNGELFAITRRPSGASVSVNDELMLLVRTQRREAAASADTGETLARTLRVPLAHGIHARPAARIAECARGFGATVMVRNGGRDASAVSPVAMLTLGIGRGDEIAVSATGADADAALEAVCALIESGMGELAGIVNGRAPVATLAPTPRQPPRDGTLAGVTAAPGRAVGVARWLRTVDRDVAERASDSVAERERLDRALREAAGRLDELGDRDAAILDAHRALLADPALREAARGDIAAGYSADWSWRRVLRQQAEALRRLDDARLAERADDLLDVERQVLAVLAGDAGSEATFAPDTILLADDLLPSQLARIGADGIAGFGTARGGPTSHVAIIAAGMALPGIVAVGEVLSSVAEGAAVILDADAGLIETAPDAGRLANVRAEIAAARRRVVEAGAAAAQPAMTRDGTPIEVFANLGSHEDALRAVAQGAEGCGLLRTEFLFLDRPAAPDEAEQAREYQRIADAMAGRPVIVRLLDIGGDKPAPYLPLPEEENPALGLRGVRIGLAWRDVLRTQLRAVLRVQPAGQCRIMIPMIAEVAELDAVRGELDDARRDLGIAAPVELGVMIETPAAAICADLIAARADFLSIGTNDLTQYVLAMDRGNPAVAAGIDGLHPAVLRMIERTVAGARVHGRWTGVCGGLASDPLAVPLLIGLGITELSAAPGMVPAVKAAVRAVPLDACRSLAERALLQPSAGEVRALARAFESEHGA